VVMVDTKYAKGVRYLTIKSWSLEDRQ